MKGGATFRKVFSNWFLLSLCSILPWLSISAPAQDDGQRFSIGFSRSLFTNVNENDAKASIKAWAQTVARERNIKADPTAYLFSNVEEMAEALKKGAADAMGVVFKEYVSISRVVETDHVFLTRMAGRVYEEYVLLAQDDSGIGSLDGLMKGHLIFHDSPRTSLAFQWLEWIVKKQNLEKNVTDHFGAIKHVEKLTDAVLPLFFGKADMCLVTQTGFSTMVELNPQIGRKLRVIAKSAPLVPALLCFRKDYASSQKEIILTALKELHRSSAGQQVLTIFQAEALVEVDSTMLEETRTFLSETL